MEIKRITEILVETKRRIVVRGCATTASEFVVCHVCGKQMRAAEEVAAGFGISRRAIYRLVEQGAGHFIENAEGEVWLCLASLAAWREK